MFRPLPNAPRLSGESRMVRFLSSAAVAAILATTQLPATAQPAAGGAMRQSRVVPKGVLIETKDEALAKRLLSIARGAPGTSYRIEGYQTVQYGSLPLADLEKTKESANSRIIIVVGPRWRIILTFGARAAAYQQRVLQALAAVDKSTYQLDVAK